MCTLMNDERWHGRAALGAEWGGIWVEHCIASRCITLRFDLDYVGVLTRTIRVHSTCREAQKPLEALHSRVNHR